MNRKYESPTGREPEPMEPLQRLREVERRLRQARPREPVLDWAELQGVADWTGATVERPASAAYGSGRRTHRYAAVAAGSWACGVVVGALAMFLLARGPMPGDGLAERTARHETQTPLPEPTALPEAAASDIAPVGDGENEQRDAAAEPSPAERPEPVGRSGAAVAMIDRFGGGRWVDWSEGVPLRAGMHLVARVREMPEVAQHGVAREPRPDHQPGSAEAPAGPFEPAPHIAITRDWLLEDLQREMGGLML